MGKIWSWMLLLVVACVFTAGTALAQDSGKPKHQRLSPEDQFKKWDANSDGKVTLDELKAAFPADKADRAEKMFKAIAGDKDSFTLDDYKAFREKHGGKKKADKPPAQ